MLLYALDECTCILPASVLVHHHGSHRLGCQVSLLGVFLNKFHEILGGRTTVFVAYGKGVEPVELRVRKPRLQALLLVLLHTLHVFGHLSCHVLHSLVEHVVNRSSPTALGLGSVGKHLHACQCLSHCHRHVAAARHARPPRERTVAVLQVLQLGNDVCRTII